MFARRLLPLVFSASSFAAVVAAAAPVVWYDRPARETITEALPLGNGRLGVMVHGGPARERLTLNEGTLWQGGPYDPTHAEQLPALAEVRKLVFAGRYKEADALAEEKMMGRPKYQASYQPLGELAIECAGADGATDYRRELDLDTATARVTYTAGGVRYTREVFVSAADQVAVVRFTASQPGKIDLVLGLSSPQRGMRSWQQGVEKWGWTGGLGMRGRNVDFAETKGALQFEAVVRILHDGGRVLPGEEVVSVRSADSVTLLIGAATNYRSWRDLSGEPKKIVADTIAAAEAKGLAALQSAHLADYQPRFRRLGIALGPQADTAAESRPTDERVARFARGEDPALAALYVQFARYLLLSCSREGGQPATLQGLWNDKPSPPWGSKYTININTEMNYWPADPANVGECVEPLVKMVEDLAESGARTARTSYGARGWVAHHNTDLWRATAPIDGAPWGLWPMGGAWLCLNLWDHYEFTGDRAYLARIYPLLRGASEFFLDTLVEEPTHKWLVTCPSISPENLHPAGVAVCAGPTMDNVILRALFDSTVAAAAALGRDAELRKQIAATRDRLPPLQIGKAGQLQEWTADWDLEAPELHHRHISHLIALHPGREISPLGTPALAAAARKTLALRGDAATGWSLAWKINFWARLHDGERAKDLLTLLLSPDRTYTNLFDAHPPFQIDGNFGGAAGILEMLVQSQRPAAGAAGANTASNAGAGAAENAVSGPSGFEIHLLPALPKAWPEGKVSGVRARGGVTVDLAWQAGKVTEATFTADRDGTYAVRFGPADGDVRRVTLVAGRPETLKFR